MAADLDSASGSGTFSALTFKMQHSQNHSTTQEENTGVLTEPLGVVQGTLRAVSPQHVAVVVSTVLHMQEGPDKSEQERAEGVAVCVRSPPLVASEDAAEVEEGTVEEGRREVSNAPDTGNVSAEASDHALNDEQQAYPPVGEMESGEGPPYAPPGWRWRVGRRQANGTWTDRYFYPPGGKREFASKKQVEQYLKYSQPGIDLDAFWETYRWRIPAVDASGEKRRTDTGSDASARPSTSDSAKRARSSRESSPAAPRTYSMSPAPNDPRSCPKRNATCALVLGKSRVLEVSKVAPCDICCAEDGFCRTCSCIFCNGDVRADGASNGTLTSIWCNRATGAGLCGHAAHLRCALANKTAVSNKKERTVNYLCRRCEETNILSLHDGRPIVAGNTPPPVDGLHSHSTSLASGTSKLDPSVNGHGTGAETLLSTAVKKEPDQTAERNGVVPGEEAVEPEKQEGHVEEGHVEEALNQRLQAGENGLTESDSAQRDTAEGGAAAQAEGNPPLEALNSFTGRGEKSGAEQSGVTANPVGLEQSGVAVNLVSLEQSNGKPEPVSEDPFDVELARALLHLPDGLPDEGAPPLADPEEFRTKKQREADFRRSKELLIAVSDGLRERGDSDSGDEPQASTPGGLEGLAEQTLAGRRILAEEKGIYGLRKSASQQSFDSGYSTPPDEVIDGVSRPKRSRGRARTPRSGTKPSQWGRHSQDMTNGAQSDERTGDGQLAVEVLPGREATAEKQWNIPPKKRGGPGRSKRKAEAGGIAVSRETSVGFSEDAQPASEDENVRNPPKSRFVTDGFHRTAARVKKEEVFEVTVKRADGEDDVAPIPIGSKVPRASRSARHARVHMSAAFFLTGGEQDSPAHSNSQPLDSELPESPNGPALSGMKRKLDGGVNGPAPKRKGRPPGSKKDSCSGRGVVVDFETDLDGAMNGGYEAARAWLRQQAGLSPLESQELVLQEERVHGACQSLKQQLDMFVPSGRMLFSRLDETIDKLKTAKDAAKEEIGEYHKMIVRLLDDRGVHMAVS